MGYNFLKACASLETSNTNFMHLQSRLIKLKMGNVPVVKLQFLNLEFCLMLRTLPCLFFLELPKKPLLWSLMILGGRPRGRFSRDSSFSFFMCPSVSTSGTCQAFSWTYRHCLTYEILIKCGGHYNNELGGLLTWNLGVGELWVWFTTARIRWSKIW